MKNKYQYRLIYKLEKFMVPDFKFDEGIRNIYDTTGSYSEDGYSRILFLDLYEEQVKYLNKNIDLVAIGCKGIEWRMELVL